MEKRVKILICGCGNMGGAMLAGWLVGGIDPAAFTVVDPFLPEVPQGVRLLREVPDERFDFVLLGVKPQSLAEVAPGLAGVVEGAVLLSILAGAELATLSARFPTAAAVVRVMPNLAAAIGKSPLGLVSDDLDAAGRAEVTSLLAPLGTPEWLESRKGCITGSKFRDARDRLKNGNPSSKAILYAKDVARERCGGTAEKVFQNAAMTRVLGPIGG